MNFCHFNHHPTLRCITLAIGGLLLILAGLLGFTAPTPVRAQAAITTQTPEDAEYVGARECGDCHRDVSRSHDESRHVLTLQDVSRDQDRILADFTQGESLREVQFPGEDTPRPFTTDDIAYAVGSGRHVQRYLYEVDRDQYAVFPAEWNVAEQVWQPYTLAENWLDPAYDWNDNCAGCHTTGLNPERGRWEDDGVQCESCHGPGSVHVETVDDVGNNPDEEGLTEIRASIVLSPDPQICGQCHNQGIDPEAERPYPANYLPGAELVGSQSYTLVAPDDSAHWWSSGHARSTNMQYNEWLESGHANALVTVKTSDYADDTCLQCHSTEYTWTAALNTAIETGEHEGALFADVTVNAAQFGVTCASCHEVHGSDEHDYLLTEEPYTLCTSCHRDGESFEAVHHPVQEMFEGTTVVDLVAGSVSRHFTEGAECTTCHMPTSVKTGETWYSGTHTMAPALPGAITDDQPDSCTGCHSDLSQSYMQEFVDQTQVGVRERLTDLEVAVGRNPDTPDWVRTAVAFIAGDGSLGIHNFAYTSALLNRSGQEMGITQAAVPASAQVRQVENPVDCAECHEQEYSTWQGSPHANASLNNTFLQQFAADGRPSFCMSCHASGFDPRTEEYLFEGVTCSNCHYVTSSAQHPPGPVEVASDSAVCGQCHSGAHAPSYDEWLVSSHSAAGIDCADCHTPHENGLLLGDVNATCGSCHEEALVDEIHMGEDMTCVDCHMTQRVTREGVLVTELRHTLGIDPGICAECHGNTHLLSFGDTRLSDQERSELETLQAEVDRLQDRATQNLNSGVVGGAIGALVLVVIVFVMLRLRRLK